jgi:hypothetical protein
MACRLSVGSIRAQKMKVRELRRKASALIALSIVLALALPAVAGAQFLDPTLDQYAPSTQQIDKKIKDGGDDGQAGGEGTQGHPQVQAGGVGGDVQQADGEEVEQGGANGQDRDGDVSGGGGVARGGDGGGTPPGAQGGGGADTRVLSGVPVTWFDFVGFVIAIAALVGTAVVLRRVSRSPTVGG